MLGGLGGSSEPGTRLFKRNPLTPGSPVKIRGVDSAIVRTSPRIAICHSTGGTDGVEWGTAILGNADSNQSVAGGAVTPAKSAAKSTPWMQRALEKAGPPKAPAPFVTKELIRAEKSARQAKSLLPAIERFSVALL